MELVGNSSRRSHHAHAPVRTHTIHGSLCPRVYSGDVSTQDESIRLCPWAGDLTRPHTSLTLVRKYVYTPHQRRGVVVVVNEKALV